MIKYTATVIAPINASNSPKMFLSICKLPDTIITTPNIEGIIPNSSCLEVISLRKSLENKITKSGEESTVITLDVIVVILNDVIQLAKCMQRNKPAIIMDVFSGIQFFLAD